MKLEHPQHIFGGAGGREEVQIFNFIKIRPVGGELSCSMRMDWWTLRPRLRMADTHLIKTVTHLSYRRWEVPRTELLVVHFHWLPLSPNVLPSTPIEGHQQMLPISAAGSPSLSSRVFWAVTIRTVSVHTWSGLSARSFIPTSWQEVLKKLKPNFPL